MQNNPEAEKEDKISLIIEENSYYDFYIGKNAGKRMLCSLQGAKKSIKVISPYITVDMIDELNFRSAKGVNDIKLITAVSKNLDEYIVNRIKKLICFYKEAEYHAHFDTVFFKNDILHEKLYIIDDEIVYSGSFNFTRKGIYDNFETAIILKNPEVVKKTIEHFNNLFSADLVEKWNVADLGKIIYNSNYSKEDNINA